MIRDAVFSPDHVYRWRLSRTWDKAKGRACWIGLNPSIAGKEYDDPTTTRIMKFTELAGYGGMILVNLIPFISTDPKGLPKDDRILPREAGSWIQSGINDSKIVIAAWGVLGPYRKFGEMFTRLVTQDKVQLWSLGRTKDGSPRHPLYVPYSQKLERWTP